VVARVRLPCANVFHAGDGNLHPLILFDANKPGDKERTIAFGDRILELCIEVGGTITGEHGVGVEKLRGMCAQFGDAELARFLAIKRAFDEHGCSTRQGRADARALRRVRPHARARRAAAHPELPRF
jgi:glycolate oxidase